MGNDKPQSVDELLRRDRREAMTTKKHMIIGSIVGLAATFSAIYVISNTNISLYKSQCQSLVENAPTQEIRDYILNHPLYDLKGTTCKSLLDNSK